MCRSETQTPLLARHRAFSATKSSATQNAASFKTQGVLAPLLVRELDQNKYEVVAGARRLRAARIAGLESIPVRVVQLTDAEVTEARVVENLQREDIQPGGVPSLLRFFTARRYQFAPKKLFFSRPLLSPRTQSFAVQNRVTQENFRVNKIR